MRCPRVGHIDFINCLPLTYSFNEGGFARDLMVQAAVPAVLNQAVIQGLLDISPVSSIIYARHSDKFLILPDVSITADNFVQSIILVSRKPIAHLTDDKIILTAKSATSHCLLKIVLNCAYGAKPKYEIRQTDLQQIIAADATATLLIGDDALYVNHHHESGLYYYDIGAQWKKFTGLRMVYAVWVVNRRFAKMYPTLVQLVYERIIAGFRYGYQHKVTAIQTILEDKDFTFAQLDDYLEVIKWDFTPQHQAALQKFYEMAAKLHLLDNVPKIELAEVLR